MPLPSPNEKKGLRDALLQNDFEKSGTVDPGNKKGLLEVVRDDMSANQGSFYDSVRQRIDASESMADQSSTYDEGASDDAEDSTSTWLILGAVALAVGGTWWMMSKKK